MGPSFAPKAMGLQSNVAGAKTSGEDIRPSEVGNVEAGTSKANMYIRFLFAYLILLPRGLPVKRFREFSQLLKPIFGHACICYMLASLLTAMNRF
jgi:hypothetical protein